MRLAPTRLYLDTARLGLMCKGAQRAIRDFAKLLSEEGLSLYGSRILSHGVDAGHPSSEIGIPTPPAWPGIFGLQQLVRERLNLAPTSSILFAYRTMSLATMFTNVLLRQCQRPLTLDVLWPPYLRLLSDAAKREGRQLTVLPVRRLLFDHSISSAELEELVADKYRRDRCDGLFLPSVSHDGIHVPVEKLRERVDDILPPKFVIVDGAQGFAHLDTQCEVLTADVYLAGAHKWLSSGLPLGLAVLASRSATLPDFDSRRRWHDNTTDGLHLLCREITAGGWGSFGETVNVAPLFSCFGALAEPEHWTSSRDATQQQNRSDLLHIAETAGWIARQPVADLRTGIILLRHASTRLRHLPPRILCRGFADHGVAVTCYSGGRIRLSSPRRRLSTDDLERFETAVTNSCTKHRSFST